MIYVCKQVTTVGLKKSQDYQKLKMTYECLTRVSVIYSNSKVKGRVYLSMSSSTPDPIHRGFGFDKPFLD